jgi:hypothetical protein
VLSLV